MTFNHSLPRVQWFPGHMHQARLALRERMREKDIHAVIMLLDARLPGSSLNPMIDRLTGHLPRLLLLNKYDLADDAVTEQWIRHYQAQTQTQAIRWSTHERSVVPRLVAACRALAPGRSSYESPLRLLICGIPNVGKSTLINTILGRKIAKTGNEPAITKAEQRVVLAPEIILIDTPGMLWPKVLAPEVGVRLAISGAIGRNAIDEIEIAYCLLEDVQQRAPEVLMQRYRLSEEEVRAPLDVLFERVALRCGALQRGAVIDAQKAAERMLDDFRSGALGRISLETPVEYAAWMEAAEAHERDEAARVEALGLRRRRPRFNQDDDL
jgi:ribosome biogenesis GTPase A